MSAASELATVARIMASDGLLVDISDIVTRVGESFQVLSVLPGADDIGIRTVTAEELLRHGANGPLIRSAFEANKSIGAVVMSSGPYVMAAGKAGMAVRPMLDDLAQLIGPTLPCATTNDGVRRALRRRGAALWHKGGCLCAARELSDAHAIAMVAEKGCRAEIESSYLGGGHTISRPEALLMRVIYLTKYSRKADAR